MIKKQKNPDRIQEPSRWLYGSLTRLAGFLLHLLFRLRIDVDPAVNHIQGPVVLIGNHPSYLDPLIMAVAIRPRQAHFLATREFFRKNPLKSLLMRLGAIPKTQFRTDMQSVRNILSILHGGGWIALYPEGQRSIDGRSQAIDVSLAKLIYKAKPTVVLVKEQGAYLAWPRWSKSGMRFGPIHASVRVLLTPDQIPDYSADAIHQLITDQLMHNEYEGQKLVNGTYRTLAPAHGLHLVCHQCPACEKELAVQSGWHNWHCRLCGSKGRMDLNGRIRYGKSSQTHLDMNRQIFSSVAEWHEWQVDKLRQALRTDSFERSFDAILETTGGVVNQRWKPGKLVITRSRLMFFQRQKDKLESVPVLDISLENRLGISAFFGKYIEIAYGDQDYRLTIDPGQAVIMIADLIQAQDAVRDHKKQDL